MSASGGFGLLEMVLELDTGQCVTRLQGGWIVRSHIGWGGEGALLIRVWNPFPTDAF